MNAAAKHPPEHDECLHPVEIEFAETARRNLWLMIIFLLVTVIGSAGGLLSTGACIESVQANVRHLEERNNERVRENSEIKAQIRELDLANAQRHQALLEAVLRLEGKIETLDERTKRQ